MRHAGIFHQHVPHNIEIRANKYSLSKPQVTIGSNT